MLAKKIMVVLTLMLAGRAMTLAFILDAGGPNAGDPPAAWLMPLVGDAIIGLTAPVIAYLLLRGRGLMAWTTIIAWNIAALWDALSAFAVHTSVPWPEFFMIETFGISMFFMAAAMHIVLIVLAWQPSMRRAYGLATA